jgi:hypothetical protein
MQYVVAGQKKSVRSTFEEQLLRCDKYSDVANGSNAKLARKGQKMKS